MNKKYEIDMCHGPLFKKIMIFALPLMLSGIMQLLFNAADIIVVGQFADKTDMAAVGATGSLINLLINLFIGLSVGTNVLVAQFFAAKDDSAVSETVHTSILVSLIGGVILIIIGVTLADPLLRLMGTPEDVHDKAALYMRIYFIGMPVVLLYNFGAAVLRAIGDTKRPLYFLLIAGVVNVVLNMFCVIVLKMGVAGVATATVISQVVSAFLVVRCLMRMDDACHLDLAKLKIHKVKLLRMIKIGLPAGLQGAIFSISNVLIQSSINSFGSVAMAGNTAASNLEGFVYTGMNAFYQTSLSFTSQNLGGKQYKRIGKVLLICMACVTVVGVVMGGGAYLAADILLRLYSPDAEVLYYGALRMGIICTFYFLCGAMDVLVGSLRGLGASILPMIVSLIGACLLRIIWIYTIFAANRTLEVLYISYPITWAITAVAHLLCFVVLYKRLLRRG